MNTGHSSTYRIVLEQPLKSVPSPELAGSGFLQQARRPRKMQMFGCGPQSGSFHQSDYYQLCAVAVENVTRQGGIAEEEHI